MNVYCKDCIFFKAAERTPALEIFLHADNDPLFFGPPQTQRDKCLAPQNFKDRYNAPSVDPISHPRIINQFNDCKWYVPEEDASSSSSGASSSSSSAS